MGRDATMTWIGQTDGDSPLGPVRHIARKIVRSRISTSDSYNRMQLDVASHI